MWNQSVDQDAPVDIRNHSAISPQLLPKYSKTAYSVSDAVTYAEIYFDQTRANSLFGFSSGVNCQNFASQCVWAGLLDGCEATGTNITTIPAVSTSLVGSDAPNVWCRNQYTTYYSHYTNNWAWDNVNGFLRLIHSSNHNQAGPQGYYWTGIANASAGDVIIKTNDGTHNYASGYYDHAMFVTKVTGTYGSRGVGDLFIAANTNPSTSAYQPLTDYSAGTPASYFATAHITGGYYLLQADIGGELNGFTLPITG